MVYYLKYRPQKISELDSSLLRDKIEPVLKGKLPDEIPHAFLFTGPKGLGKTSAARILAKAINCTNRKKGEIEPCNICASCKAINNGSSLDVMELDGASNRGIDEIRDLREKIRLSPLSSKKKVYIIDEVHMLTSEAFNALLKTLEEPPSHAVFILCTTEPQKVPGTIISRCFHVRFDKATDDDLIHSFSRILKGEGIKAEPDALLKIAQLSEGSFRDGAKILEELSAGTKNITSSLVEKKFKTQSINKSLESLISALYKKDAKAGVMIIDSLAKEGIDFKIFTEELINKLHGSLLQSIEGKGDANISEAKELLENLVGAHMSLKYAVLPQLPLELLVVEWCFEGSGGLASKSEGLSPQIEVKSSQAKPVAKSSGNDKILEELIESIKADNFSIAGVLRGCQVEKYDRKTLSLSTKFEFHKERLNQRKTLDLLEQSLKKITGNNVKVNIV